MSGSNWNTRQNDGGLVVSRPGRTRLDLVAEVQLGIVAQPKRLAHQIRQDIWRALQHLRGFSPVVEISTTGIVRAGGQVDGPIAQSHRAKLAEVLASPSHQARWQKCSGGRV